MSTEQTCTKRMGLWGGHPCGKPMKGIGPKSHRPLCGLHLAAEKRVVANDEKRDAAWKRQQEYWNETQAIAARLSDRCGVAVHLSNGRGTVSMSLADFERLFPAPAGDGGAQ